MIGQRLDPPLLDAGPPEKVCGLRDV